MKRHDLEPDAGESRAAVATTVAWMLTCMSTAAAMLVVLALRLLMLAMPMAEGAAPHPLERIAGVMLFVALMTGGLCLLFTVLAHFVRKVAPPRAITAGAVLIAISPLVLLIVLSLV